MAFWGVQPWVTRKGSWQVMINLLCSWCNLPFNGLSQIIVVALGHRRLLLCSPRERKPNFRPKHWRYTLSNKPLQSDCVSQSRQL
uniref:Uncharacterized protein n=1 Tax=Rhizophora mucronata TaxID=61149 RepID=A0A2P2LP92_RHIMU